MFGGPANTPSSVTCAQVFANLVASSGWCQGVTGCGGIQRSAPTGGAAYGMPKNSYTPSCTNPRTGPSAVRTTGPSSSSAITGVESAPAANNEPSSSSARVTPFRGELETKTSFHRRAMVLLLTVIEFRCGIAVQLKVGL